MQHRDVTVSTEVLVRMVDEAIAIGKRGTDGDYTSIGMIVEFVLMGREGNDFPEPRDRFDDLADESVANNDRFTAAVRDLRNAMKGLNGHFPLLADVVNRINAAAERAGVAYVNGVKNV